jgi:O-antigen ligase
MSWVDRVTDERELIASDVSASRRSVRARIAHFLDRLIWRATLALLPLVAIFNGAEKAWWQAAFECYAFALATLWIVKGFFKGRWHFKANSLLLPLVLLIGYTLLQTIPLIREGGVRRPISANVLGTYRFAGQLFALIVIMKLLLDYTSNRKSLQWLINIVIAVTVGSAAFGVFQVIAQQAWPSLVVGGQTGLQGFGQFSNRNYFALLLEMGFGLELGMLLMGGIKKPYRALHIASAILLAATIVLTTSRGGVFTLLAQITLLGSWFVIRRVWRSKRSSSEVSGGGKLIGKLVLSGCLICGVVAVSAVTIVQVGGDPLAQRVEKLPTQWGDDDDSVHGQRGDIWRATWLLVTSHPMAGTGFGAYYTAIPAHHVAAGNWIPSSALNDYLNLLSGGGAIALLLAASFAFLCVRRIRINLQSHSAFRAAATLAALGGLLGVAMHSLVDAGLQIPLNSIVFVAIIVIGIAKTRSSRLFGSRLPSDAAGTFVPFRDSRKG